MPRAVRSSLDGADPRVFRALADPTRRRILRVLGEREMRASDVAARFPVSRPAISKHLRVLREAGLVRVRKAGRERLYAIVPGPLRAAAAHVDAMEAFWREAHARLAEQLAAEGAAAAAPRARGRRRA